MKQGWTFFIVGVFCVLLFSFYQKDKIALADDARVKKIEDTSLSGIKTEIPLKEEMDASLKLKETELKDKEEKIKEKEERLAVEELRLKLKIQELEKLRAELEQTQEKNKIRNKEILAKMVKTFESMAPKKAAGVLSIMSDPLAVELLLSMKEKKVALVLNVMDPTRAMTLSSLIAKRRPASSSVDAEQAQPDKGANP